MGILISVIVPTYNRAGLITMTLESLLNQTFHDFEIIVVDDGSTDNTEDVVRQVNDARINYYRKTNGERGAARNYGAGKARGSYVNFFDSDDIAFPDHLSVAADTIRSLHNPEIFSLGYNIVSGSEVIKEIKIDGPVNDRLQKQSPLGCNSVFIRKDIIEQYPFSTDREIAVSEDLLLWLTLSSRFTIHGIPVITSSLVQHEQRSMITDKPEKILRRMELITQALKKDDTYMSAYGHRYLPFVRSEKISAAALAYARQGRRWQSVKALCRAVWTTPSLLFSRRFPAVIKHILTP